MRQRTRIVAVFDEQDATTSGSSHQASSLQSSFRDSSRTSGRSSESNANHILAVNTASPTSILRNGSRGREEEKRYTVEVTDLDLLPSSGLLVVPSSPDDDDPRPSSAQYKKRQAPRPPSHSLSPPPLRAGRLSRSGESRKSSLGAFLDQGLLIQEEFASNNPDPQPAADAVAYSLTIAGDPDRPLGLQLKPLYNDKNRLDGVEVANILESGRAFQDAQLAVGDVITEICERPVYQMSFVRVQSYLHEVSSGGGALELGIRRRGGEVPKSPPSLRPSYNGPEATLQKANTRKIGQKIPIALQKKRDGGLGFSVTSRDTSTGGDRRFFIKTIMPRGSAIEDGRLAVGDRVLTVNGEDVGSLSQTEIVSRLRAVGEGDSVDLVVSRTATSTRPTSPSPVHRALDVEEETSPSKSPMPRPLAEVPHMPDYSEVSRDSSEFTMDIPLNSSGCAGLGVSVKGRMIGVPGSGEPPKDCGIFVKAIMHGGAAHKDGRLRVNDQLIAVNGTVLSGVSNEEAITLITKSYARLQAIVPNAQSIRLRVLRHATSRDISPASSSAPPLPTSAVPPLPSGDSALYATVLKASTITPHDVGDVLVEDAADGRLYRSGSPGRWEAELSVQGDEDPFDRESSMRKSLSEKRHIKASNNPAHIQTYQRIKHQRQASAPDLDNIDAMLDVATLQPSNGKDVVGTRRSLSLESLSTAALKAGAPKAAAPPMIHELVSSHVSGGSGRKKPGEAKRLNLLKKTGANGRVRNTNESFRQAVDKSYPDSGVKEVGVDVGPTQPPAPVPDWANGAHSLPRQTKAERRKSAGTSFFARFRFGSESRDRSDEAGEERQRKAMQEEQRRIREQYERLKRQQEAASRGLYPVQQPSTSSLPPNAPFHPPSNAFPRHPAHQPYSAAQRASSRSQGSPYLHRREQPRPPPYIGGSTRGPPLPPPHYLQPPPPAYNHYRQSSQPLSYADPRQEATPWAVYGQRERAQSHQRAGDAVHWDGAALHPDALLSTPHNGYSRSTQPGGEAAWAARDYAASPTFEVRSQPSQPPPYAQHLRLSQRKAKRAKDGQAPSNRHRPASNLVDYRREYMSNSISFPDSKSSADYSDHYSIKM